MLIWLFPGWVKFHKAEKELAWFAKQISSHYREILEKMTKVAGNFQSHPSFFSSSDARETIELGEGPFGLGYFLEIFQIDPNEVDFMQKFGAAPKMGVAIDIIATETSQPKSIPERVGHVYEDGKKGVTSVERY